MVGKIQGDTVERRQKKNQNVISYLLLFKSLLIEHLFLNGSLAYSVINFQYWVQNRAGHLWAHLNNPQYQVGTTKCQQRPNVYFRMLRTLRALLSPSPQDQSHPVGTSAGGTALNVHGEHGMKCEVKEKVTKPLVIYIYFKKASKNSGIY